uniref:Uncharacterized protein n=1 Tax=Meloidogyne hapla TaxID=6305 RepID=A0A1I8B1G7_MELHA
MLNNAKNNKEGKEAMKTAWKIWLNGESFLKKYKHFLLILCLDELKSKESENLLKESENYCRFIESRIRLELIFTIEEDEKQIKYTHATGKEKCLPKEIKEKYSGHYIQHWWVGIETNKNIKQLEFNNILIKFIENIKNKTPLALLKENRKIELIYYNLNNNSNELVDDCLFK